MSISRLLLTACFIGLLPTARSEELSYGGGVRAYFESAYISSSGGLGYTRPVAEQYADAFVAYGAFGRLSADMWTCSDLTGQKQAIHQRAFYCWEGRFFYGRDISLDEKRRYLLKSDAGFLWDWFLGYRKHTDTPIYWNAKQSFENPYLTPYWNILGRFEGGERNCRIQVGLRRAFVPYDDVTVTPFFEAIFGDSTKFREIYGGEPDERILGGTLMNVRPGVTVTWFFRKPWYLWGRYRHYFLIDPEARSLVRARGLETDKTQYPVFGLGVGVKF